MSEVIMQLYCFSAFSNITHETAHETLLATSLRALVWPQSLHISDVNSGIFYLLAYDTVVSVELLVLIFRRMKWITSYSSLAYCTMEHIFWSSSAVNSKYPLMTIFPSGFELTCLIQLLQSWYLQSYMLCKFVVLLFYKLTALGHFRITDVGTEQLVGMWYCTFTPWSPFAQFSNIFLFLAVVQNIFAGVE